jgi:BirA family biotin operon repressor/biotin-[acetyl-CoA-carboxylase] ligase
VSSRPDGTVGTGTGAWRLEVFADLPSTAEQCRRLAEAGEPGGLAILAHRQTAGRGTRGRSWESVDGNLFLSVLLRPDGSAREAGQWSLLAGVAVAAALARSLPEPAALGLKWPNDVLLHGRKLGGILVESVADGGTISWLSVGIGVNLAAAPAVPGRETACLADVVAPPSPETAAAGILDEMAYWSDVRRREGFAPVRAAFLERAPARGTKLTLRHGARILEGAFAGLGADGSLLVETDGHVHAFAAGEVTIGHGA